MVYRKSVRGIVLAALCAFAAVPATEATDIQSGSSATATQELRGLFERRQYMDVEKIQQLLAQNGYDPGPVDGNPGRRTRAAIESFQRDHGLPVDSESIARASRQRVTGTGCKKYVCSASGPPPEESPDGPIYFPITGKSCACCDGPEGSWYSFGNV
jgi:peptidoglycan hydrolase-like protein with peptidoglycan-binding domain